MDNDDIDDNEQDSVALVVAQSDRDMISYDRDENEEIDTFNKDENNGDEEYRPEEDVQLPGVDDLPLFASAEARKIDIDIKQKEMDIEVLSEKASDMVERLKVMKSHFKNVQQELDHTNELSTAKQAEMKTEKHLQQLTSRAVGQNQAETKRLTLELEKLVIMPSTVEIRVMPLFLPILMPVIDTQYLGICLYSPPPKLFLMSARTYSPITLISCLSSVTYRVQDELSLVQSNIHKSNEKMDEFKMKMNWLVCRYSAHMLTPRSHILFELNYSYFNFRAAAIS